MLEIRLLGQFQVNLDGSAVEINSRPAQLLLAYLALNAGTAQRRERVAGLLWPESAEENARTYLRQALWRVRREIGESYIVADRMKVGFDAKADTWLDAAGLELEPAEGWTADALAEAVSAYEGDLLPGFYDEWAVLERERIRALYERRMDSLLEALLKEERWDEVLHWGEQWLAMGGAPEPAYRALMQAHAAHGNLSAVKAVYKRCVQALDEELGVPPSAETKELYRALVEEEGSERPDKVKDQPVPVDLEPVFLTAEHGRGPEQEEPFIGRERELALLERTLQATIGGRGRVVFITGEAGRGKTTLLHEFARRAQAAHPDLIVTNGVCPVYTPVCAPYGIFREALEILTGDVEPAWTAGTVSREQAVRLWQLLPEMIDKLLQIGPHLIDSLVSTERLLARAGSAALEPEKVEKLSAFHGRSAEGGSGLSEQGKLFAEYADLLTDVSRERPLLLILDDLHWADSSSIGLLGYLGHRLGEGAVMVIGAYRPEEVSQGREGKPHPLVPVLSEYKRRFGQVAIKLDEADAGDGRAFIDALLDREENALDEAFRQALTRHTGGHPLFTVELLRAMQENGALQRDEEGVWVLRPDFDWHVVPPKVEGVIETRISQLDDELRSWLDLASVEGEAFTAEAIAQALDVEARFVVKRLSQELDKRSRLVAAQGTRQLGDKRLSRYTFRHNLFRDYLYNQLDDIERSYLHQQVGESLEGLFEGRTEEISDQLAHHFQLAGVAEKVMIYLAQAGDEAGRVYAYDEAQEFYEGALALARQLSEGGWYRKELSDLFMKLGRTLEHRSNTKGALAVYQEMESLGRDRGDPTMTLTSLAAQGTLYSIASPAHDPKRGQAISEQALTLAQEVGDRAAEARILRNLMAAYGYDNKLEQAIQSGERSLILARDLPDRRQLANTLSDLVGWYWVLGQIDRAKELSGEAINLRREAGNQPMLADVLTQSYSTRMYGGEYDEAIAMSDEAWQISESIDNKWNLAFSRSRIGFVHRARGELGQSIAVGKESRRLGEEQQLPEPQIFAGAELAFTYAYLGAADPGLEAAQKALIMADEKGPSYRPYALAALAQNYLTNGDLPGTEGAILQARSDSHWGAFPMLCLTLDLADGRLALAQNEYRRARQVGEALLEQLRRFGARAYLPETLALLGEALLQLGRGEEARNRLQEGRKEAKEMGARGHIWPILFRLSAMESDRQEAQRLRQKAREIIDFIADHAGEEYLRESFLALPEVQAVIQASN